MSNIQQEYWLKTKRTIQSTIGEDDILWYQSDYVQWLEKELMASRDSRILSAVPSELLKKIEELSKIVPMPPKAITYENGVEIVNFVQDIIMPEYYNWVKRGIAG